jgi:predicted permease
MNLLRNIRSLFRKNRREVEMAAEMRHHVELQTELNLKAGMNPDEARYAALRKFGNVASIQEQAREGRGWIWLENLVRDFVYAVRTLRKSAGYTSVVVLTLALGLGVNMALFTWFNAAAFRPLPVREAEQLFSVGRLDANGTQTKAMSYADFISYRENQTVFSGLAASTMVKVELLDTDGSSISSEAEPARIYIDTVSPNYFSVFGVPMTLGRPLLPADEDLSRALPVIVLSHRFWQNNLGGDPAVIGRTLRLRGLAAETLMVVGVAGEEFCGTKPGAPAGWAPALLRAGEGWRTDPRDTSYTLTGRLRPSISKQQATEELQVIANAASLRIKQGADRLETVVLTSASSYLNLTAQNMLVLLPMIGLFGAVFIVSCANASNLILARTVTRQFEFAVRGALGATRTRLLAQLLTENLVLGVLGGLAGWGVSAGLLRFAWPGLLNMVPMAREGTAGLYLHADYRVFGFTLVFSLLTGVAGGLWPALHVTRSSVDSALKQDGSAFGRGLRLSRVRSLLAVGQLMLSSALVFTAGLLVHRALSARFTEVGFDKTRILLFETLAPRTYSPGQLDTARREVLTRLQSLSEVAAISEMPHFPFASRVAQIFVPDDSKVVARGINVFHTAIPSNYFTTLQLPLLRGRGFNASETVDDRVAVISETAARTFWPAGDALGQRIEVSPKILATRETSVATMDDANLPRITITVVGVASDTRVYDPWTGDRSVIYLPLAPQTAAASYVLIRTKNVNEPPPVALREAGLSVTGIAPRIFVVDEVFANAALQFRVFAWVGGILAFISLLVAVIGLYGVMSFTVNQRVKEIGIRIALGATPGRVVSGIVFDSLRLVGIGAALGYGLSVMISRVARAMFSGVDALDPVVFVAVTLLLTALGLLACWIPARRAAKVDPVVTLRAE